MNAQEFTQAAVAFLASITFMNILINFVQLWLAERKKCSIMVGKETNKKASLFAGKKHKKYAVLQMSEKTA